MGSRLGWLIGAGLLACATPAAATYSIVGADSATREVGGAGTSCLNGADVYIIYGAAPGLGAVHAQARANQSARDRAVELLEDGQAPSDIIDAITNPDFDGGAASRQYGIVDTSGRSAGYTGSSTLAYAADRQGRSGVFSYSVQGNILTSEAVLSQAAAAFEAGGCDLPERLMRALEAGAQNGEGDSRCTPDGIPADSAFLQVERPDVPLGDYVSLRVESSGSDDPLLALRQEFDAWRATHPCPPPVVDAGAGGSAGSGGLDAGSGGVAAGAGAPGGSGTGAADASGGTSNGGSAPAGAAGRAASSSDGCGCRIAGSNAAGAALAPLLLGLLLRRRTRGRQSR